MAISKDMASPCARLGALATAVPDHVLHQEDVMRGAAKLFRGSFHDFDRLIPVSTGIWRSTVSPSAMRFLSSMR